MRISIALPCYEMHGRGAEFLSFSLEKIYAQTHKNIQVVISDNSVSDAIENVAKEWSDRLYIKYLRRTHNLDNPSENMNNAIGAADGDAVKLLFQDDFLFDRYSIEKTVNSLLSHPDKKWFASSSQHSPDGVALVREFNPMWNDRMIYGVNTISSPSVILIRNDESKMYFDSSLFWLMDCDLYHRYHEKYGEPVIINEVTVVNRLWKNQATNTLSDERKNAEHEYIKQKYNLQ